MQRSRLGLISGLFAVSFLCLGSTVSQPAAAWHLAGLHRTPILQLIAIPRQISR
jgi:hypothetical protein